MNSTPLQAVSNIDRLKRWLILSIACVGASASTWAQESNWPSHPVRLVVSSSAGGGTDMYARILSQALGGYGAWAL